MLSTTLAQVEAAGISLPMEQLAALDRAQLHGAQERSEILQIELVKHSFTYAIAALQSVAGRRSQDDASCDLRLATCEKEIVKCLGTLSKERV